MTEVWKPVAKYDNYEVSNLGKVRNKKTGYILKPFKAPYTYGFYAVQVHFEGSPKHIPLAPLIAEAFLNKHDNPKYTLVQHKNRVKTDNRLENLEWTNHLDYPDYHMGVPKGHRHNYFTKHY
jgi:hypothetical protein